MSIKRKDPPVPFKDSDWVGPDSEYVTEIIKVKAPYIYADALCNCRVRLARHGLYIPGVSPDLGPLLVDREVRRAKRKNFRLPTVDESRREEDPAYADTEEQHAKILFELEVKKLKLADKLGGKYESFKRNFEGMILRYATLKKNPKPAEKERRAMLEEREKAARKLKDTIELDDFSIDLIYEFSSGSDHSDFKESLESYIKGISTVIREIEPIRRGPRAKQLNAASAEEILDLMKKYKLKPTIYKDGIWCGLLRILLDAIGESGGDPRYYIKRAACHAGR